MALQDTIFLGLVFCLGQRIQAQEKLPVPTISAAPSSVIPWNASVKILCQGTPESFQYQLSIMENSTLKVVETKLGFQKEAEFLINHMNATTAGCYQCRYRKRYSWSEHSKILELVVTGFYDKPVLSTDQSLELRPGENISFRCHSAHIPFDRFSLAKEEGGSPPQQERGGYHSMFNLGPVSPKSTGSYRCYGWYDSSPYVWSSPSDALELTVAEVQLPWATESPHHLLSSRGPLPRATESPQSQNAAATNVSSSDSKKQDYRTENSIRLTMAGLVLVALLVILAENWHSQEPSPQEDWHNLAAQYWNKQECKT